MNDDLTLANVTFCLVASPDFVRDGTCFAGRAAGLSVSTDGGETWADAYAALGLQADLATPAVALSPNFAADGTVFAGVSGGVLISHDRGSTWRLATMPDPAPLATALQLSPDYANDGAVLLAAAEDGVFRSTDRGGTWADWNVGLLDPNVLCLAWTRPADGARPVWAGTETGLFLSGNAGLSWRESGFSPELAPVLAVACVPAAQVPQTLFAGTEENGLWRSDDGGEAWRPLGAEVLPPAINSIQIDAGAGVLRLLVLADDTLYLSPDGGAAWQRVTTPAGVTAACAPLGLAPAAPLLVAASDGATARLALPALA